MVTGYGVVDSDTGKVRYVASGCLRLPKGDLPERLRVLYEEIGEVIRRHQPEQMAVEQVFVNRNIASALKLGHARGAVICAGAAAGLPIAEYSATQVKQAVSGTGRAEKTQVQHMIKALLGLQGRIQADAADALAVALCHANMAGMKNRLALAGRRQKR